ncbi:MAG: metallophosphoesterase [Chloroflexota bacterium]
MKKIIHLSDLHIGYEDMDRRFKCIVDHMLLTLKPADDFVVVITGDLVHEASLGHFRKVKSYLDELEEAGMQVLVVPGNHDYGSKHISSKKYVRMFKEVFFDNPDLPYPKLDIIDTIAFLGLDSMADELHWHDRIFAEGELGEAQLARLESRLNSHLVGEAEHVVVYLHHHPFQVNNYFNRLKDSEAFGEIIKSHNQQIDLLLFGHNHQGRKWNGVWGVSRCLDAGSSTTMDNSAGYHRIIDLSNPDPRHDYDGDFHCNYLPQDEWPE